jgi:hypothetical protein
VPTTGRAHGTLLGVAPPVLARLAAPKSRSPVFVRSGVAKPGPTLPPPQVPLATPPRSPSPREIVDISLPEADLSEHALPVPAAPPVSPLSKSMPLAEPLALVPEKSAVPEAIHPATVATRPEVTSPVAHGVVLSSTRVSAPSFLEALTNRVRWIGVELPLWVPVASLVACCSVALAVGAMAILPRLGPPMPTQAAPAHAVAAASVAVPTPAALQRPTPDTTTLAAKPAESLTSGEVLLLNAVSSQKELEASKAFRDRVAANPSLLEDKAVLSELRKLMANPNTAREALAGVAAVPGPLGADILYEVWTGTPNRTATTDLARALVYTPDVRAKASPALLVALELRVVETCEQNHALLPRAIQAGDRRSLNLVAKLKRNQGCGPNKRQDCYPCLREGAELDTAIKTVKTRRAPTPLGP